MGEAGRMRKPRLSPATVIAFTALLVALSAPAWGASAVKLIKGKQIARNAITSNKIKDGSLLAKDFKKGELPQGADRAEGRERRDRGDRGDRGHRGHRGHRPAGPGRADGVRVRLLGQRIGERHDPGGRHHGHRSQHGSDDVGAGRAAVQPRASWRRATSTSPTTPRRRHGPAATSLSATGPGRTTA